MMRPSILLKRSLIFLHRWMGVALSVVFMLWFVSGIVMMYWSFPGVGAGDRRERAPVLDAGQIRVSPEVAYTALNRDDPPTQVTLTSFDGRPVYRFGGGGGGRGGRGRGGGGGPTMVYADDGTVQSEVNDALIDRVASSWAKRPSSEARKESVEEVDQWTVEGGLRNMRPLYKYSFPDGQQVYVNGESADVVQYTTTDSRFWAYLGAIPHWLYFTPLRKHQPEWFQLVVWSSLIGTIASIIGIIVAIWMISPSKKYRHAGAPTSIPYKGWKRWHMIIGLFFGVVTATWAFSGLLSMGPFPIMNTVTEWTYPTPQAPPQAATQVAAAEAPPEAAPEAQPVAPPPPTAAKAEKAPPTAVADGQTKRKGKGKGKGGGKGGGKGRGNRKGKGDATVVAGDAGVVAGDAAKDAAVGKAAVKDGKDNGKLVPGTAVAGAEGKGDGNIVAAAKAKAKGKGGKGKGGPRGPNIQNALRGRGQFDLAAYAVKPPAAALASLNGTFEAKELDFTMFDGQPLYMATNSSGETRIVPLDGEPKTTFSADRIMEIVKQTAGANLAELRMMDEYDAYYLDRNRERPLPVVYARMNDSVSTRYYIDPVTGRVAGNYNSRNWISRWLYRGLHSMDFPWLYNHRPLWDIVVITLMLGGTALCVTSLLLTYRVLARKVAAALKSRIQQANDDLAIEPLAKGDLP